MTDNGSMPAAVGTGIALIGLCSIPAVSDILRRFTRRAAKQDTYEDEDGKASPESIKAYSARLPKSLALLSAATGCAISIACLFLSAHSDDQLPLVSVLSIAAWVCLGGHLHLGAT